MNNIFHYSIVSILLIVALIGIFSEPSQGVNFTAVLVASKTIGISAAYVAYKLIMYWNLFNANTIEDIA